MIDKLEWNLAENDSYKEEKRSDDDTGNNSGEKVRYFAALEADKEIGNLEEEKVGIIEEIEQILERKQKDTSSLSDTKDGVITRNCYS